MHLTDEQLNEYLDHESSERPQIEAHLSSCEDCAARLASLEMLFSEIESLPDVELTSPIIVPTTSASALPRWLTLTATLQAGLALLIVMLSGPLIADLVPAIEVPSLTDVFMKLQLQWLTWLDRLSLFQMPAMPQLPVLEMPTLMLMLTLAFVCIVWLVGNGLLLKRQLK